MNDDFKRLCDAAYDAANNQGIFSVDDLRAEDVVRAVLTVLRTPSEAAAQAGGSAASAAMMGFASPANCGLAAVRGTIDFILAE